MVRCGCGSLVLSVKKPLDWKAKNTDEPQGNIRLPFRAALADGINTRPGGTVFGDELFRYRPSALTSKVPCVVHKPLLFNT